MHKLEHPFRLTRKITGLFAAGLLGAAVGCSSPAAPTDNAASAETTTPSAATSEPAAAKSKAVSYTDYTGHTVDIPADPQRVIYYGETLGDLLELGVTPIATSTNELEERLFSSEVPDIQDVGSPPDPEKSLSLSPDLIITADTDEKLLQTLSKVAPTITFNTFAPLEERMTDLGVILSRQDEAAAWLKQYDTARTGMWNKLHENGVGENETASVFTFYPGNRLFVMAGTGLPQALYQENGFAAPAATQKLIDEGTGFLEISPELLDEYAGDRIFILNAVAEEAQESTEDLLKTAIWKKLPAVQADHVYRIDILKASSDAYTLEALLNVIPELIGTKS